MLVLALDCATSACSVALWQDGIVLARRHAAMARGQSEVLVPMIAAVMAEAATGFDQLDLLAVTVGPGAFTGIRIGLSTARALALVAGKPLAGIATPDAMAAAIPEDLRAGRTILVAVESRRAELWLQAFDAALNPLGPPAALLPEQAASLVAGPVLLAGDGAALVLPHLSDAIIADIPGSPDAVFVAALAASRWPTGTLAPEPLYLRPPDVTMPSSC